LVLVVEEVEMVLTEIAVVDLLLLLVLLLLLLLLHLVLVLCGCGGGRPLERVGGRERGRQLHGGGD